MMTFNDFVRKNDLKNTASPNIKIQQVLSSLSLDGVGIYLRDGPFKSDIGIVNCIDQKVLIGFVILTKINLIVMDVSVQKNYLNLL